MQVANVHSTQHSATWYGQHSKHAPGYGMHKTFGGLEDSQNAVQSLMIWNE